MTHPAKSNGRPRMRLAGAAALLLLALVSCTTGIVYNRLDRFAYWYFSRQVTLTEEQRVQLRGDLRTLLQWHRTYELPRYAALLESLSRDAEVSLGRPRIEAARTEIEALWRDLVQHAAPRAALWLADLGDGQLDELFESLAEEDEDRYEEYCEPDERTLRRRRERSITNAIEDWTGRLSREQRALVRETAAELEPTGCLWVRQQQQFRQDLRRLLDERSASPRFGERLARFLLSTEERWSDEYRAGFTANRERIVMLLAELDATLSERQRARLAARLARLARDLRDLSRAKEPHGELGDEHDVLGGVRRPRVPDVSREYFSADPL